jgi:hypothetical protein
LTRCGNWNKTKEFNGRKDYQQEKLEKKSRNWKKPQEFNGRKDQQEQKEEKFRNRKKPQEFNGRKYQQEQKEKKSVNWKKTQKSSMEGSARKNGEEICELEENTQVFNRRISKNKWRRNPINWGKKTGVQWKEQEEQMQKKSANWKKTRVHYCAAASRTAFCLTTCSQRFSIVLMLVTA